MHPAPSAGAAGERTAFSSEALLSTVRSLYAQLHRGEPPLEGIDLGSRLEADLGFDSMSRAELLLRIGRRFEVELPDSALASIETLGDLAQAVSRALEQPGGAQERTAPAGVGVPAQPRRAGTPFRAATLIEVLDWRAQAAPAATHLTVLGDDGATSLTYGQLRDGARRLASGLQRAGVRGGARVALMLPTSIDYFHAFLGTLLAGAIPVPIYPPLRPAQIEEHVRRHTRILQNAGAQALITFREARAAARLLASRVVSLEQVFSVEELTAHASPWTAAQRAAADAIAMLQYTSGSTGDPKGVILTHADLLANIRAMGSVMAVKESEVFVSWLPLYHDMGLIGAWLGSLYFGCLFVVMPPQRFLNRPARWLQAIHEHRATLSAAPNFGYDLAAQRITDAELEGLDLSCWRIAFNGAEPVVPDTIERFAQRFAPFGLKRTAMTPVYGLAEAGVGLTFPPLDRGPLVDRVERSALSGRGQAQPAAHNAPDALHVVSCGRALPGYRVRIMGSDGIEVPERIEGSVQFTGPSATRGYYENPEATLRIRHDGWLDTGDLGYLADGELYITGRNKDLIIRRGHHIYPQEIEQAVGTLEGVRKGCVVAFGAAAAGEATERLVVLAESPYKDAPQREALRARINQRVIEGIGEPPDEIVLAVPHTVLKTSSGKLRRAATRAAYLSGRLNRAPAHPSVQLLRLAGTTAWPAVRRLWRAGLAVVYGLYVWLVALLFGIALTVLVLAIPGRRARWRVAHRLARWLLCTVRIPMTVLRESERRIEPPCIVVANHCSYIDSLVLVALLPQPHRFVAKRELKWVPVLGTVLIRLGTLFIERDAALESIAEIERLRDRLARGEALVAFPEGTFTSVTGLRPFRLGAFELAARAAVPVLPIALRGTRTVLRDGHWLPRRAAVSASIGAALGPVAAESPFAAAVELRDAARAYIRKHSGEPDLL